MTLLELTAVIGGYLYLPDPGIVEITLAAVAANCMSGAPLWLLLIGPPSSAKTEVLDTLSHLPNIHPVSTFSEAGLISGSSVSEGDTHATGGLLIELGDDGILVFKDVTTLLSEHGSTTARNLACLREVYDGKYTRRLGTKGGRTFEWQGKAGLIGAVTEAIDMVDMGLLGERFLYFRLPAMDDQDILAMTLAATDNAGHQHTLRAAMAGAVTRFFCDLDMPQTPPPLNEDDKHRLKLLADFATRCRSPVVRDGYQRHVELVPTPERPPRLAMALAQLLGGLRVIGVSQDECWRLLASMALDAMHSLRRRVLDVLVQAELALSTASVAGRTSLPEQTAVRHLEDLTAHGVVVLVGRLPDRWEPSAWCRARIASVMSIASGTWERAS